MFDIPNQLSQKYSGENCYLAAKIFYPSKTCGLFYEEQLISKYIFMRSEFFSYDSQNFSILVNSKTKNL